MSNKDDHSPLLSAEEARQYAKTTLLQKREAAEKARDSFWSQKRLELWPQAKAWITEKINTAIKNEVRSGQKYVYLILGGSRYSEEEVIEEFKAPEEIEIGFWFFKDQSDTSLNIYGEQIAKTLRDAGYKVETRNGSKSHGSGWGHVPGHPVSMRISWES